MAWTRFMDMHSGGGLKEEPYSYIYIEASEEEARVIFYNRFGHNPERVTCTCCGEDYSISSFESLSQATAYDRGCRHDGVQWLEERRKDTYAGKYRTLRSWLRDKKTKANCLFIRNHAIKDAERRGEIPKQGYVWMD